MSSALAVAAATEAMRRLLDQWLVDSDVDAALGGGHATVSSLPPDQLTLTGAGAKLGLNLFLHRVSLNQGWRNECLPAVDSAGNRVTSPPLAVDLHFVLSAYGTGELQPETLLGHGMQALQRHPVITRAQLTALLPAGLGSSGLATQVEQLRIVPESITGEEASRLWSAFQARYRPSFYYLVSVVLIEVTTPVRSALPVLTRGGLLPTGEEAGVVLRADLLPRFPTLTALRPAGGQNVAVSGGAVTVEGELLAGTRREVHLINLWRSQSRDIRRGSAPFHVHRPRHTACRNVRRHRRRAAQHHRTHPDNEPAAAYGGAADHVRIPHRRHPCCRRRRHDRPRMQPCRSTRPGGVVDPGHPGDPGRASRNLHHQPAVRHPRRAHRLAPHPATGRRCRIHSGEPGSHPAAFPRFEGGDRVSVTELRADDWASLNQRMLHDEFERLAALIAGTESPPTAQDAGPSALDAVTKAFGLSGFERGLLALCAGVELHPSLAAAVAANGGLVSWWLARQVLPDPHWSALSPGGALRRWHLLEMSPGRTTHAALTISERILHYLVGVDELDAALTVLATPLRAATLLPDSHATQADEIAQSWADPMAPWQPVALHGDDEDGRLDVAWTACASLGLRPFVISSCDLPTAPGDRAYLATVWTRDALLSGGALVVTVDDTAPQAKLTGWLSRVDGPVIVSSRYPVAVPGVVHHEVRRPDAAEQRHLWRAALGQAQQPTDPELTHAVDLFASTRRLSAQEILTCTNLLDESGDLSVILGRQLHRADLDGLVRVIHPAANWSDLVLAEDRLELLRAIADQVRHRATVHEDWGFAGRNPRGLGTTALFVGEPGTGKTLAAEVLAGELALDLLHVDLSAVVSKYIGETEKNLCRIFDGADESGAILLFDEADALFGKRSEVRDSHDRYANIEVSYLLQRMEAYRGLALLTTNARAHLDHAFVRRLGFVVQFPFPDREHRRRIWDNAFPSRTPTIGIDPAVLSSLVVSGGSIRNIAIAAAFRAAAAGAPVRMSDIAWAARAELAKSDCLPSPSDFAGWDG